MSIKLETRLVSEVAWNWQDSAPSSATRTQGTFRRQLAFSSSGTPQVDGIWLAENAQVSAFSSVTHDLTDLHQTVYGASVPVSFAALCTLYVFNRSETLPLVIANTGSSASSSVLTSSFVNVVVPPGGFFALCNPASNWTISSTRNEIQIQNAFSSAISYDLFLTGTQTSGG